MNIGLHIHFQLTALAKAVWEFEDPSDSALYPQCLKTICKITMAPKWCALAIGGMGGICPGAIYFCLCLGGISFLWPIDLWPFRLGP